MQGPCKEVFGHICLNVQLTPSWRDTRMPQPLPATSTGILPSTMGSSILPPNYTFGRNLRKPGSQMLKEILLFWSPPSSRLPPCQSPPGCRRRPAAVLPNPDRREIITWKKVIMWSHPESKKMPAREGFLMVNHLFCTRPWRRGVHMCSLHGI